MVSMRNIFSQIVKVNTFVLEDIQVLQDSEEVALIARFVPRKNMVHRCPYCQNGCPGYDRRQYLTRWRCCDFNGAKLYIEAPLVRVCCPEHGVHVEYVPWAAHASEFTHDFDAMAAWLAAKINKTTVSEYLRIAWATVGSCIRRCKERIEPDSRKRYEGLKHIGIDETSFKKGHKYLTVVVNHDTSEVVWAHEGHDTATLSRFFTELTPEQRDQIEAVSGDGAKWIDTCVERYCPKAVRCIDSFHVVQWTNEAVDKLRIEAWRSAIKAHAAIKEEYETATEELKTIKDEQKRETKTEELEKLRNQEKAASEKIKKIKNSKFALGKAPENLTESQIIKLGYVKETDKKLFKAYDLKELLRTSLKLPYQDAEPALKKFFWKATHSRIKAFQDLAYKIRRHKDHILNTIKLGLSNARVEGINRKIKGIIYKAYGFSNINNLICMLMLVCSNLRAPLPHRRYGLPFG